MATWKAHRLTRSSIALSSALLLTLAGCGSDGSATNAADRSFLQQMIPHHERAIAVARIGARAASDARVRAFAARIVREQTPELARMRDAAKGQRLDLTAGARTAHDRITDGQVAALRGLHGASFDRQFVRLHISSETGAAEMAETELHDGRDGDVVGIAKPIATAPTTQIPELRRLLTALER